MTPDEMRAFNDTWLKAWTDKDVDGIAAMYAPDCSYWDSGCKGLTGREALRAYLQTIFPHIPAWEYRADEFWPMPGGFCARWFCQMGETTLRGFDFVQLRDGLIVHNEVYTHAI